MEALKNNILQLSNSTGIKVNEQSFYSLKKFINNLHIAPNYAKDFNSMVQKIQNNYVQKSIKMEQFFIKNILHTTNKKTGDRLIEPKFDIAKNFNKKMNKEVFRTLTSKSKNFNSNNENEIINLSNSLYKHTHNKNTSFIEQFDKKYGFICFSRIKYIDFNNTCKTPVMLTFTLDKHFRKYAKYKKSKDTKLGEFKGLREINKNANLEELIEKSYHELQSIYQKFYDNLKSKNSKCGDKDKLDFIFAMEPHKSLTLHLHIIFYCNDVQLKNLEKSWKYYLSTLSPKQKKAQDYKVIDTSISNASTYLAKYLIKEYNTDSEDIAFFNMYKRYFSKFNLFRTSKYNHTTQKRIDLMYRYLLKNYPDIIEAVKKTTIPLYEVLEQFEIQGLFSFENEKISSISFNRKLIKDFYEQHTKEDIHELQIKDSIIENIDLFSNEIVLTRIKSATFEYDHQKILDILNSFKIDTSSIIEEKGIPIDIFYQSNIYHFERYKRIDESLSIYESYVKGED